MRLFHCDFELNIYHRYNNIEYAVRESERVIIREARGNGKEARRNNHYNPLLHSHSLAFSLAAVVSK
jgi:hypothetical protein